jgi:hypothetical protein
MPNHMLIIIILLFSHFIQPQAKYCFGYRSNKISKYLFERKFIILYIYLVIIYHNTKMEINKK